jgi:hypothetical protein
VPIRHLELLKRHQLAVVVAAVANKLCSDDLGRAREGPQTSQVASEVRVDWMDVY